MIEIIQKTARALGIAWLEQHGVALLIVVLFLGALTFAILARFGVPMPPQARDIMKERKH